MNSPPRVHHYDFDEDLTHTPEQTEIMRDDAGSVHTMHIIDTLNNGRHLFSVSKNGE